MNNNTIRAPYLIFLGAETRPEYAKTGAGLAFWRPELVAGQFNLPGGTIDLGVPSLSIRDAKAMGVKSLVIGTASVGGVLPNEWLEHIHEAISLGMDIVSGLHQRLNDIELLQKAAIANNSRLVDVRIPPTSIPVANGKPRSGKRLLTVGTDCAIGKKYSALQVERDMKAAGINASFRATGQTGIMIAGEGIPIDSVVSDFVAGAAELVSPDNSASHWDVIEGQGSLFHPGYSAVSMGLLVGSQPDAFIVCHEANRNHFVGWESFYLPSIQQVINRTIDIGAQFNPDIKCVGLSVNTSSLKGVERIEYMKTLEEEFNIPVCDPLIDGTSNIVSHMIRSNLCEVEN